MVEKSTCCSGGAKGADLAWGDAATRNGHGVIHFIFKGHKSTAPDDQKIVLPPEYLEEADIHLIKANKTLKRKWPVSNPFTANLLRRNYYQVLHSSSLYAIASFDDRGMVTGGTAWAVQMMIDLHPDGKIFVYDQNEEQWFQWKGGWLPIIKPPAPSGTYAGIGSRDLSKSGQKAIDELWN